MTNKLTVGCHMRDGVGCFTLEEIRETLERKRKEYDAILRNIGMYSIIIEEWKKEGGYLKEEIQSLTECKALLEYETKKREGK